LHGIPGTLGSIVAVVAVACASTNFPNEIQLTELFPDYPERSMSTQTWYQVAGIVITWGIAIPSGALVGFLASRMPMPEIQFDDTVNFCHVEYGDDTA